MRQVSVTIAGSARCASEPVARSHAHHVRRQGGLVLKVAGAVHGGSLGRWFEKLCRIECPRLQEVTSAGGTRLKRHALPDRGGVYAFWWTGRIAKLRRRHPELELSGPGGRRVRLMIDAEWLGLSAELPVPLYVGKTATSISKRVRLHMLLGTKKLPSGGRRKSRPTTSCQLRSGVDHFFPKESDTRDLMLRNVGLSFVCLHGDSEAANRFYLEDLAIGLMRPPFNIDIER